MKGRHLRIGFVFAVFAAAVTLGFLASAQEDQPLPPVPEEWVSVGNNLAIMLLESDSGDRVGRLMFLDEGVWLPLYLESMPRGIEYLNKGRK